MSAPKSNEIKLWSIVIATFSYKHHKTHKLYKENRPFLVTRREADGYKGFPITTRYEEKLSHIRSDYYKITNWQEAGLDKPSYIDAHSTPEEPKPIFVPFSSVYKKIGCLQDCDTERFKQFCMERHLDC